MEAQLVGCECSHAYVCPVQDFNLSGQLVISSGMDHALKVWDIGTGEVEDAVKSSYQHKRGSTV